MSFTTYFSCRQCGKGDFLTLLTTQSNYRHKNNKRGSGIRMSLVDFFQKSKKRGRGLFETVNCLPHFLRVISGLFNQAMVVILNCFSY